MIAYALAWVMIFTTFFSSMAPIQVQAAEVTDEVIDVVETVEVVEETGDDLVAQEGEIPNEWARLLPSANNNNGHFGHADRAPEAFILSQKADVTDEELSATLRVMSAPSATRVRFVTKYVNDSNWAYLALEPNGSGDYYNWGYEFNGGYGSVSGLPQIHQYDVFNLTTSYVKSGDTITGMNVSVENLTTGENGSTTVTIAGFIALGSSAGKAGLGAAYYQLGDGTIQITDLLIANVKIGTEYVSQFSFYRDIEGQSLTTVTNAAIEAEINGGGGNDGGDEGDEGDEGDTSNDNITREEGTGRAWWTLNAGANNGGGHNYGNASVAAPVVLLDNSKVMADAGELSMAIKPNANWGIFYSYVDDNILKIWRYFIT